MPTNESTVSLSKSRWSFLGYTLIWIPECIRNFFYGIVAKNRYLIMGKKEEECKISLKIQVNNYSTQN